MTFETTSINLQPLCGIYNFLQSFSLKNAKTVFAKGFGKKIPGGTGGIHHAFRTMVLAGGIADLEVLPELYQVIDEYGKNN